MASLTPFSAVDLLHMSSINLDPLTENYDVGYYMEYLIRYPDQTFKTEDPSGRPLGYMLGKIEGDGENWHSHISAVTVDKDFRRLGIGAQLVHQLVLAGEVPAINTYFMDLYVRESNRMAVEMYKRLGFHIFRKVIGYYSNAKPENALDMRRPLKRDRVKRTSLKKGKHTFEETWLTYDYNV